MELITDNIESAPEWLPTYIYIDLHDELVVAKIAYDRFQPIKQDSNESFSTF